MPEKNVPETWRDAHRALYGSGAPKLLPKRFSTRIPSDNVWVSYASEELFADYEQALLRLHAMDPEDREGIAVAYGALCMRRRAIYEHLSDMERHLGRKRPVLKRF